MKTSSAVYSFGRAGKNDTLRKDNRGGPGPGMYNTDYSKRGPAWRIGTSDRSRMIKNENTPGVGQYTLSSGFGQGPKYSLRPKTYYDEAKNLNGPGPGNYNPNFNSVYRSNERYTMRPKTADVKGNKVVPGPGNYSIRDDSRDLLQPSYKFGKERRDREHINPDAKNNPGPGNYTIEPMTGNNQAPKFSFGKEERGTECMPDGGRSKGRPFTPGPGQYGSKSTIGSGPKISMSFNRPNTSVYRDKIPGPGQYSVSNVNLPKAPQYK